MTKFDALADRASIAVTVLGNADGSDIEMLPIAPVGLGAARVTQLAQEWAHRNLHFVGTIGIVDGRAQIALVKPLDARRVDALSAAFVAHCETLAAARVDEMLVAKDVAWLNKLWNLPDNRLPN